MGEVCKLTKQNIRTPLEIAHAGLRSNFKKTDWDTIEKRCECCNNGVQKYETEWFGDKYKICQECYEVMD